MFVNIFYNPTFADSLNIQTGRTCVMHLVPREKIPEPNIGNIVSYSNFISCFV